MNLENDKVFQRFLDSLKRHETKRKYKANMEIFSTFVNMTPTEIKTLREEQEKSDQKEEKFFFENKLKEFHLFLQRDYKGIRKRPLSQSSASSVTIGVRGYFKFLRSDLKMQKGDIPQPTMTTKKYDFRLHELQVMFKICSHRQRAILTCGVHWGFGANDFVRIRRDTIELYIQQVKEGLKEYPIAFDMERRKTHAPHRFYLVGEIADALEDYWKTIDRIETTYTERGDPNIREGETVVWAFPKHKNGEPYKHHISEENLNDILQTIWKQAFPNLPLPKGLTWHRIRAFFIATASGVISDSEVKRFCGKKISADMFSYLNDHRLLEAWEKLVPKLSLTGMTNRRMARLGEVEDELTELRTAMQVIAKYTAMEMKRMKVAKSKTGLPKYTEMRSHPEEIDEDIATLENFAKKKVKKKEA